MKSNLVKNMQVTKLVNICAWCGKEQYGVFDDSASISHGICQECLDSLLRDKGTSSSDAVL